MPLYEHVFLARQDISPQQAEALIKEFGAVIEELGGKVPKTEYWGLKSLAYKMKKARKAHYALMNIDAPPAATAEMERRMSLSPDILRFQTVRVEELEVEPSAQMRKSDRDERGDRGDRAGGGGFRGGREGGAGGGGFRGGPREGGGAGGFRGPREGGGGGGAGGAGGFRGPREGGGGFRAREGGDTPRPPREGGDTPRPPREGGDARPPRPARDTSGDKSE